MQKFLCRMQIGFVLLFSLQTHGALRAEEWSVLGSRAMGMGGAGVAVTRGSLSTYWNPAGLAPHRRPRLDTAFDIQFGMTHNTAATGNILEEVDDISDIIDQLGNFSDLEDILDDPSQTLNSQQIQDILQLASTDLPELGAQGSGLLVNTNAGFSVRASNFAFSALGLLHAGGLTIFDASNFALGDEGLTSIIGAGNDQSAGLSAAGQSFADSIFGMGIATQNQAEELIFQAEQAGLDTSDPAVQQRIVDLLNDTVANAGGSLDNIFTRNGSGLNVRGILLQEYAVSYATDVLPWLSIGATAKLLHGTTYFREFTLDNFQDSGDLLDEIADVEDTEESLNFGIDIGALLQPTDWLSIGLVARNLNAPSFDFDGPGDYDIEPQVRVGFGLQASESLLFALDADVLINDSEALKGYESQMIGGGLEYSIGDAVFLRTGLSKNLAESEEGLLIHGGFSIRLARFSIELSGSMTPEMTEVDGNDVPERAGAAIMLGINVPL